MEDEKADQLERLAKHPIVAPQNADEEPTDSNPVPLSPTEPKHRTSDGAKKVGSGPGLVAVPAAGMGGGMTGGAGGLPLAAPIVKVTLNDKTSDEDDR